MHTLYYIKEECMYIIEIYYLYVEILLTRMDRDKIFSVSQLINISFRSELYVTTDITHGYF